MQTATMQSLVHPVDNDEDLSPLDERVIQVVQQANNRTLRPALLATRLGISVDDACAELCGLMAAVGSSATFAFDTDGVMQFEFPVDFETRARRKQQRESYQAAVQQFLLATLKLLKIITAFGLILSLLIMCVAAIIAIAAAIIAMSRAGHGTRSLQRQLRSLFCTIRQLLWCYALFGPNSDNNDPFFREIAMDLSLAMSLCCGNPMNIFFWMRAHRLSERRRSATYGWSGRNVGIIDSDVDGVHLIQQGQPGWNVTSEEPEVTTVDAEHRGLLSVAVEFLFGPVPGRVGPTSSERWRLRTSVILQHAAKNTHVPLKVLGPYVDEPPASTDDVTKLVQQGMLIVAHFNGVPDKNVDYRSSQDACFIFPELMAESNAAPQLVDYYEFQEDKELDFRSVFYKCEPISARSTVRSLPSYLKESKYRLTKHSQQQFIHCVVVGALNLVGVFWLGQSISTGGYLEVYDRAPYALFLKDVLLPALRFYALLFFALPMSRLVVVLVLNFRRHKRNVCRAKLAEALNA